MNQTRMTFMIVRALGMLGISAAIFLYTALLDLLADFHHGIGRVIIRCFVVLAAGIVTGDSGVSS